MLRVLVVDDEPRVGRLVASVIEEAGHEVATALNGAEAMSLSATTRFNVVVSDVQMPFMSGIQLARELSGRGDSPRIILMSGNLEVLRRAKNLPCVAGVLEKPMTAGAILHLLKEVVP